RRGERARRRARRRSWRNAADSHLEMGRRRERRGGRKDGELVATAYTAPSRDWEDRRQARGDVSEPWTALRRVGESGCCAIGVPELGAESLCVRAPAAPGRSRTSRAPG